MSIFIFLVLLTILMSEEPVLFVETDPVHFVLDVTCFCAAWPVEIVLRKSMTKIGLI